MIDETKSEIRRIYRERHGALGDIVLAHDLKAAAEWADAANRMRAERAAKQGQLDALTANYDSEVLAPLRKAADEALARHIEASAALDRARHSSDPARRGLEHDIAVLTQQMRVPMYPVPTDWRAVEVAPGEAMQSTLAAHTPMAAGGGWIDNNGNPPGMPVTFN